MKMNHDLKKMTLEELIDGIDFLSKEMGHVNFTINYFKDEVKSLESLWSYLQSKHVKATNEMLDRGYMFNDGWKRVEKSGYKHKKH